MRSQTELKSNQQVCTRKQTQIKSATGPVKSQIFVKGFVNRLQINVTVVFCYLQLSPLTLIVSRTPRFELRVSTQPAQVSVQPLNLLTTTDVSLKAAGYCNAGRP